MRILQLSDLHLEFEDFRPRAKADILMLNGDICVAEYLNKSPDSKYFALGQRFRSFFEYARNRYQHVLYIAGNHEHYTGRFDRTVQTLRREFPEILILDNDYVDIGDYRFIGSTLWTDLNKQNPLTMVMIKDYMADYKIINKKDGNTYRKLIPQDTIREHYISKLTISNKCMDHDNIIVMSHHAPSHLSIDEAFKDEFHGNGGYYSDLSEFILDRPQIKLWTHGHMHSSKDYYIGNTRVVCNPRGYVGKYGPENNKFDEEKIIIL